MPSLAYATLAATLVALAPTVAHGARCSLEGAPTSPVFALARGEELGRLALSVAPDQTLWVSARVMPHRFARRPRTRVLVGALDPTRTRWSVAPLEVASLPGRSELPLALASDNDGALVVIARPASVIVVRVSRSEQLATESLSLARPSTASGPPLVDAQGSAIAVLWRSPRRLSIATSASTASLRDLARFAHAPRSGALGLEDLCGLVALSPTSAGAVFCQHSGALSIASVERGAVTARSVQPAHCPDHCERVAVTSVSRGAVATFAMKVRGERLLRSHWASRVSLDENSHTQSTIPILRGLAFTVGPHVDSIAQWSRPVVLRALERPIALGPSVAMPRAINAIATSANTALAVTALDQGALSVAAVRCERSPASR